MKIIINPEVSTSKKTQALAPKKRQTDWPTKPMGGRDETILTLDILFYNGATQRDAGDPSGFKVWDKFNDSTLQSEESHTTADPRGIDTFVFNFKQNKFEITDADYEAFWNQDNPYDRQPLERYTMGDLNENGGVMPTGAMKSNIEVALVDDQGNELDSMSAYRIIKAELPAEFMDNAQGMGYRWLNPPNGYHIRVSEKTAQSHYLMAGFGVPYYMTSVDNADVPYPWPTGNGDEVLEKGQWFGDEAITLNTTKQADYKLKDLFWHHFDTSDTTNFKLTRVPKYNCDAADEFTDGQVLKMDSVHVEISIYLIPRPLHGLIRFSICTAEGAHGTNTDNIYGVWRACPRDYMLPAPRTAGSWELGSGAPGKFWVNPPVSQQIIYDGSEAGIVWSPQADSVLDNGLYLLHTIPNTRAIYRKSTDTIYYDQKPFANVYSDLKFDQEWRQYQNPSTGEWIDYLATWYESFAWFYGQFEKDSEGFHMSSFDTLYIHNWVDRDCSKLPCNLVKDENIVNGNYVVTYGGYPCHMHLECFWGSAPDGKLPAMLSRHTPLTCAPLDNTQSLTKTPYIYMESDYEDDSVDSVLAKGFLENEICGGLSYQNMDSFLLSIGEAKAGDLVGMILTRQGAIYVWRRTDENIHREVPEGCSDDTLLIGSNWQWSYFDTYRRTAAVPCPEIFNVIPSTWEPAKIEVY